MLLKHLIIPNTEVKTLKKNIVIELQSFPFLIFIPLRLCHVFQPVLSYNYNWLKSRHDFASITQTPANVVTIAEVMDPLFESCTLWDFKKYMYMGTRSGGSWRMLICEWSCLQSPGEEFSSHGATVAGSYELPSVGARN